MSTPTNAQDVVAVLDSAFNQVFAQASIMKATIGRSSKAMEHPLETGAVITDHRIILPVTIDLSIILASNDYQSVYQQIKSLYTRGELLTVQTRVDSFSSMLIEKMPHDESPDMLDGVMLGLSLKEALFVQPQYSKLAPSKVKQSKNSTTVDKGQVSPKETPPAETTKRKSVLKQWTG